MNVLPHGKKSRRDRALVEGNSIRATARMTTFIETQIMRLLLACGETLRAIC